MRQVTRFVSALIVLFVAAWGLTCFYRVYQAARLIRQGKGAEGRRQFVEQVCNRNFIGYRYWIEANGLMAKWLGKKLVNDVVRLDNGILTAQSLQAMPHGRLVAGARNTAGFSEKLKGRGIPFLFVLAPYKMDLSGEMLPPMTTHSMNQAADVLVRELESRNVNVLDLRPFFAQSKQDVERNFYRTDHHWNGDAIMEASRLVAKRVCALLQRDVKELSLLDEKEWRRHRLQDWFLGSQGRRTGRMFAGLDDLIYYEPLFQTDIECEIPSRHVKIRGDFQHAVMQQKYVQQRCDLFSTCAYDVYLGGGFPFGRLKNELVDNDIRVLMLKDSFGRPVQAILSTVFASVDSFDQRLCPVNDIDVYIRQERPSIVVQLINSNALQNEVFFHYENKNRIR